MGKLTASAQYDDFKGTSAADNSDFNDFRSWSEERGILEENDFIAGAAMYAEGDFFTSKLVIQNRDTKEIREVTLDISMQEFLAKFKRLSVVLLKSSIDPNTDYPNIND